MDTPKARVLVVDDDPYLLDLLVDTLSAIGYAAVPATDGLEALDIMSKDHFDLVVTDVKMPGMDGITLLRKIKRRNKELPVVFITGVATPEAIADASPDGMLAKPFRFSHIEQMIDNALNCNKGRPTASRVLILDDDSDTRNILSQSLIASNYLPFAVDSEDAAIRELENGKIDIVLASSDEYSDIHHFTQRVRAANATARLILMRGPERAITQYTDTGESEVDAVIDKPLRVDRLLEVLSGFHAVD